jgi:hypothetical protein
MEDSTENTDKLEINLGGSQIGRMLAEVSPVKQKVLSLTKTISMLANTIGSLIEQSANPSR